MNIHLERSRLLAAAIAALAISYASQAHAIVVDAVADTWIRQNSPEVDYGNDWISVRANPADVRYGVIEFDLSVLGDAPITSISLELFDPSNNQGSEALVQSGYLLSLTPPEIDGYTWQEYLDFDAEYEEPLESLGAIAIEPGEFHAGYNVGDQGTAADIALLNSVRSANSDRVVFILKATSGLRDWYDIEQGSPPRLRINENAPAPGDLNGDGVINADDLAVITDPANWLQSVPVGTRGDLAPNGFVDLEDFHAFKTIYLAQQTPAAPIPEPAAAVMLGICSVVLSLRLRRATR